MSFAVVFDVPYDLILCDSLPECQSLIIYLLVFVQKEYLADWQSCISAIKFVVFYLLSIMTSQSCKLPGYSLAGSGVLLMQDTTQRR